MEKQTYEMLCVSTNEILDTLVFTDENNEAAIQRVDRLIGKSTVPKFISMEIALGRPIIGYILLDDKRNPVAVKCIPDQPEQLQSFYKIATKICII